MAKPYITAKEVKRLKSKSHVCIVHPRNKTVVVDGFKYYRITQAELEKYKE
jgi:hypothetical protein